MTAKEALSILQVSRRTLSSYVKTKKIRVVQKQNGFYDYNDADVIALAKPSENSKNVILLCGNSRHEFQFTKMQLQQILAYCLSLENGKV